jgi:hypothetical protein
MSLEKRECDLVRYPWFYILILSLTSWAAIGKFVNLRIFFQLVLYDGDYFFHSCYENSENKYSMSGEKCGHTTEIQWMLGPFLYFTHFSYQSDY